MISARKSLKNIPILTKKLEIVTNFKFVEFCKGLKETKIVEGRIIGSRAHVHQYSAEICGIERDRIHQREECNCDSEALRSPNKEFRWRGFLRRYFVSTVGLDEGIVSAYIRNQEHEDERYDQMKLDV